MNTSLSSDKPIRVEAVLKSPSLQTKRPEVSICYDSEVGDRERVYAAIVRSAIAHGRIRGIDAQTALRMPGVLGVWKGTDLEVAARQDPEKPPPIPVNNEHISPSYSPLATDKVYFVGQPVALVVASSLAEAKNAADAVQLDVETLPALTEPRDSARLDAPWISNGAPGNICMRDYYGDYSKTVQAFDQAGHVTRLRFVGHRITPTTVQLQDVVGLYDPASNRCTFYVGSTKGGIGHRSDDVRECDRVFTRDWADGGVHDWECECIIRVAQLLGQPIQWTVGGRAWLGGENSSPDYDLDWELALDNSGHILAMRITGFINVGAFLLGPLPPIDSIKLVQSLTTLYEAPVVEARWYAVCTNTAPRHGQWVPVGPAPGYVMECLIDTAARELGMDQLVLRERNLTRSQGASLTAASQVFDQFSTWLESARHLADIDGFAARQAQSLKRGCLRGLGTGNYFSALASWKQSSAGSPYPDGMHVVEVEVDPATGSFAIVKYTGITSSGTTTSTDGIRSCDGQVSRADAQPAVMNALVDALGGKHIDLPITPRRVWQILNAPPPIMGPC